MTFSYKLHWYPKFYEDVINYRRCNSIHYQWGFTSINSLIVLSLIILAYKRNMFVVVYIIWLLANCFLFFCRDLAVFLFLTLSDGLKTSYKIGTGSLPCGQSYIYLDLASSILLL